jgi:hypothetical protein
MDVNRLWQQQLERPWIRLTREEFAALGVEPLSTADPIKTGNVACVSYGEAKRARAREEALFSLVTRMVQELQAGRLSRTDLACAECRGMAFEPSGLRCVFHQAQAAVDAGWRECVLEQPPPGLSQSNDLIPVGASRTT